jgi:hypothetical protein
MDNTAEDGSSAVDTYTLHRADVVSSTGPTVMVMSVWCRHVQGEHRGRDGGLIGLRLRTYFALPVHSWFAQYWGGDDTITGLARPIVSVITFRSS